MKSTKSSLAGEFKRLLRSMTFVSRRLSSNERDPQEERLAEIYQQLGTLWEFLALQCNHSDGWRQNREGHSNCKVCGTIRGSAERWLLLPREGRKVVGRKLLPNSKATFANKKAAAIVGETIVFHGAKLEVDVHNSYRSRLFGRGKPDVGIAADRIVRLQEDDVECWLDTHLAKVTLRKHKRGQRPPFGALLSELPKRALKRFPILIEYDGHGELVGVTIFRPPARNRHRKGPRDRRRK